jgi:hypothetical protein
MATKLTDAKITVRIDTEGAEEKLDKIEDKLKKDEKEIAKAEKKQKRGAARAMGRGGGAAGRGGGGRGGRARAAMSGGITGVLNIIPFKDEIMAIIRIVEVVNPMLVGVMDEIKSAIPDIPVIKDLLDTVLTMEQKKLKAISQTINEVQVKVAAVEFAQQGASDVVRAATGLGARVDVGFVVEHTKTLLEIGEVKARMSEVIKDVAGRNFGVSAAKTFKTYMGM